MHNFNKDTKHPLVTSSYIVRNKYIIYSSFMHREVVIHTPVQSSAKGSQQVAEKHIISHKYWM